MVALRTLGLVVLTSAFVWGGCTVDFTRPPGNSNDAGPGVDAAPGCRDGVRDPGEACDGTDLGGQTCVSEGYESGTLSCDGFCNLVLTECVAAPVCGDAVLDGTELCDDGNSIRWDGCTDCDISEFLVNTETAGNQRRPAVIPVGEGFLAVWTSENTSDGGQHIAGQRFDSSATADGTPLWISAQITMNEQTCRKPAAARLTDGSFVVLWIRETTAEQRVVGRLFDSMNVPIGNIFDVSDAAPTGDDSPSVAATSDGGFVAAWRSLEGAAGNILTRRFDFDAVPQGASLRADTATPFEPSDPSVAAADTGGFLVAWTDEGAAGLLTVNAQRFISDGSKIDAPFTVQSDALGWHSAPDVAHAPGFGYMVVWQGLLNPVNGSWDIYARLFDDAGVASTADVLVNEVLASDQLRPAVTVGTTGLLVAWETQVGADWDVAARIMDFTGAGTSVQLTTHVNLPGWQTFAAAATTNPGHYIVAWQSDLQDGSLWGVYAQRFTTLGVPLGVQ